MCLLKLNDFPECDVKMEVFENFSIFTFLEGMTATFMYIQNHTKKNIVPKKIYRNNI